MNVVGKQFSSIEQVTDQYFPQKNINNTAKQTDISFREVLQQQQEKALGVESGLKISRHASNRLSSRNINLSREQSERL